MKKNVFVVCVCSAPNCCDTEQRSASNILISGKIIKEMPGSVASGTPCIKQFYYYGLPVSVYLCIIYSCNCNLFYVKY